jgi:hypothetical protein
MNELFPVVAVVLGVWAVSYLVSTVTAVLASDPRRRADARRAMRMLHPREWFGRPDPERGADPARVGPVQCDRRCAVVDGPRAGGPGHNAG